MIRIKDKIASGLGSVFEWYDFALYGFFSPIIAQLYFPSKTATMSLLKAFAVFSIGFLARPFGSLIFGYISDKYGRTTSLKLTPLLITLPTLGLTVLPTYQQIGILAPLILIALRIWQGICIGGEYANNIVYLCESTNTKRTYFLGSIGSCTGSLGIFLASSIASISYKIIPADDLTLWGWRAAFSISVLIGIVTYLMRINMLESPVFQKTVKDKKIKNNPLIYSFKSQKNDYLLAFGITFLPATAFYYIFMFLPNYLIDVLNFKASDILEDNSLSLLARLFIIPLLGILSDKIGGVRIAKISCVLFFTLSFPLIYGIIHYSKFISYFVFLLSMFTTLNAATTPGLLMELLKPETRCTILSFTFSFCFGVLGGVVPVISLIIINQFKNTMASTYYLMFASIITFASLLFFKKRHSS